MGSISAMSSIDRVLEAHGDEIRQERLNLVPDILKDRVTSISLTNSVYAIETEYVCADGSRLPGPSIDIDFLADQYPNCQVGY